MSINPEQIKAARELLGWTRADLAKRTRLSPATIGSIETGKSRSSDQTLRTLKKALEDGGVDITPWSVRLREEKAGL
jgi:transcriptional regulator with XRE-family HTH domain